MHCAQALQHGAEAADSSEEDEGEPGEPTYVQEQQDLKRSFLQVCLFTASAGNRLHACALHKMATLFSDHA